jgi:biotin transport system ATP-binding protein
MVALAAVLAMNPTTIIFDEPTTMLDLRNKRVFMSIIDKLEQQVLLVTHDLDSLADFDRVLLIEEGTISVDGQPTEAIQTYERLCRI